MARVLIACEFSGTVRGAILRVLECAHPARLR